MNDSRAYRIRSLFLTFLKIGAFTFGGGYAMIPLIEREVCVKKQWMEEKDILEITAIAESTPGPIAINSATFVGYRVAGFWGAFAATFGVVLPSFMIISVLSFVLKTFSDARPVRYAFMGVRAGVLALIVKALLSMYRVSAKDIGSMAVMAAALILTAFLNVGVFWVIIGCALFGLIRTLIGRKERNDDTD